MRTSEEVPGFFNSNLSSFIQLYDSENYMLRNAITEIIGNIIKLVLTQSSSEVDNPVTHQNKRKLLDILLKRLNDKVAYCRSTTL